MNWVVGLHISAVCWSWPAKKDWCVSLSNAKFNDIRLEGEISHGESIYNHNVSKHYKTGQFFIREKHSPAQYMNSTSWSYFHLFKYTT